MTSGTPEGASENLQSAIDAAKTLPEPTSSTSNGWFGSLLGDNAYFQAGFGLIATGALLTGAKHLTTLGTAAAMRRLLVSVELNNKDSSYDWFLQWMAQQNPIAPRRSIFMPPIHRLGVETSVQQRKNGSSSAVFNLVAGTGRHWMNYQGVWLQVVRERETRSMEVMSGKPWETLTVTTLSRDRAIFQKLLSEARDLAMRRHEGKLVIQTAWGTEWRPFGQPLRKRPLSSVVLDAGVAERIQEDVTTFMDRRKWYEDRGIPYRRGYLLHGPPGSGKSSFIQSLAGALNYDICVLNLSERGLGDDKLIHLLSNVPERSFVLIEDVDAAFNQRTQTSEDGYQSAVTFSGFLNALDGVASGDERIIFLTTNHPERLDPALVRPGRVDTTEYIGDATPYQACTLFERFYGTDGHEVREIVEKGRENGKTVSMATLQGMFIRTATSEEAVAQCRLHLGVEQK